MRATSARGARSCAWAPDSTACCGRPGPRATAPFATTRHSPSWRRSGPRSGPISKRDSSSDPEYIKGDEHMESGTPRLKVGLAEMLKGGVIMDVTNAEQAKIAEDAGAVAVMALERVPSDIRKEGGVARMSPVTKIKEIQKAVTIPVMAKCRIGHFVEAQILQSPRGDLIHHSDGLSPDPLLQAQPSR